MSLRWTVNCTCGWVVMLVAVSSQADAVGTAVNYQGQLKKDGGSVADVCTFEFTLWDAATNGVMVAGPVTAPGTMVTDGLFEALVDFGPDVFTGAEAQYLEVAVQCTGDVGFTVMSPRQLLTPAPSALALPGLYTQENLTSPNVIGGHSGNAVQAGAVGAVVGGGGEGSNTNVATGDFGQVGGGRGNRAGNLAGTATDATVGGGFLNTAASTQSTVAGGLLNVAQNLQSTVGGGRDNVANGIKSTVGGGQGNHANGDFSFIGGGRENTAGGLYDTVGGGRDNTASGGNATVAGGQDNTAAGAFSVAAGQRAQANHDGTFVFSDSTTLDPDFFASTAPNQFLINAAGGVGINTNGPQAALHVGGIGGVDGIMFPDGTLQTTAATGGGGNTLDDAYDEGGAGAGRTITADAGPVEITGTDGLEVTGTIQSGNSIIIDGTTAGFERITSTDALELHTAEGRGLRIEPAQSGSSISPNIIGGSNVNSVGVAVVGATIAGGGSRHPTNSILDNPNRATGNYAAVGGGSGNVASADWASVGGGWDNVASHQGTTVGGGQGNHATSFYSTVAGGQGNHATASHASVGGGENNRATGQHATVGGGGNNFATSPYATVPGGFQNVAAGQYSFAAGINANASSNGMFVWADSSIFMFPHPTEANFTPAADQFLARATGGALFVTAIDGQGVSTEIVELTTNGGIVASGTIQSGNSIIIDGTTAGFERIVSTDALEVHTSVGRGWRIEPAQDLLHISPNIIGGADVNSVGVDVKGVTIAGGGRSLTLPGTDTPNIATDDYATIGGGYGNTASGESSTIAGGQLNDASGLAATVGGGAENVASANYATVPGGRSNEAAGSRSFAAGQGAKALHEGTFVWADNTTEGFSTPVPFESTAEKQFLVRATGGVGINTNGPQAALHVGGMAGVDGIMFPDGTLQTTAATGSGDGHSLDAVDGDPVDAIFVNSNGRVGIRMNIPGAALHVSGDENSIGLSGTQIIENTVSMSCPPFGSAPFTNYLVSDGDEIDAYSFFECFSSFSGATLNLQGNSSGNIVLGLGGGDVGIGRSPSSRRLEVNGNASKTVAGDWLANSDRRIKQRVDTVTDALDTLAEVRLVSFEYTDEYRAQHPSIGDRRYYNVIAQEFQKVFPEHVQGSGDFLPDGSEILQLDPYPLTIFAAAAVQELQAVVEQKDAEIADLRSRLERIEALLADGMKGKSR